MSHISALGYLVVRGPLEPWRRFGTDVLGAQLVESPDDGRIRFRTDDRAWRIEVQDGPPGPDALIALGFEVADEPALDSLAAELQAVAVPVKEDRELAAARRVRRLLTFHDIEGNAIEAFVGAESVKAPFVSPRGLQFVCGDLGLGHAFMFSRNGAASAQFYQSVLGFKLSDTIAFGPENGYFLHCNPRHHSVAFAAVPGPPPGLGHLMLEVDSLEAVGRALNIVNDGPYEVLMTLGEHSNDHVKSFYVNTPSGFSIEYGWNGRLVDDAHWKIAHYDAISVWGHHFVTMPGRRAAIMIADSDIADIGSGLVNPQIYTDPDLYQLELKNVFGRSWLFLAHDSQLLKAGSFVQTYMGEDPVLVVRQRDGSVKAFLNQCRHRGMRICRAEAGTNRAFTCSYHGWSYDLEGNLINVPAEPIAYRGELDKAKWGALKVPRIACYKGFYFGCWSQDTPEFEDYLGDMTYYFDAVVDRWDSGLELVTGTTRWVIDCNWKFASEQFASDMYHVPISHASAFIALADDPAMQMGPPYEAPGRQFAGNGHGSGSVWLPQFVMPDGATGPVYTDWLEENKEEVFRRIGVERAHKVYAHNTIFPNFSWLGQSSTMRVWQPRGPGQIEVWAWTYLPKDAPDKVKDSVRQGTQRTFSPAGVFETDDGENWTEIQLVLRGYKARQNLFNLQMGLGHEERDVHGLPGRSNNVYAETAARGFYQRWSDLVRGLSWAEIAELEKARRAAEEVQPA